MDLKENTYYQRMAREARAEYERRTRRKWPGKPLNAPAASRYPNLLAELDAFPWPNVELFAEFANVSPEILVAVMEDSEEVSFIEMLNITRLLRCDFEYLASHSLALIDPAAEGVKAWKKLASFLTQTGDFCEKSNCENCLDRMRRGEMVTFAAWRRSCQEAKDALDHIREKAEHPVRTTRMEAEA